MAGIIINGVAFGLGKALFANLLADTAHSVFGLDKETDETMLSLAAKYNEPGKRHVSVAALDQTYPERVAGVFTDSLFADVTFKKLVFINNAGTVAPVDSCEQFSPEDIIAHININFTSPAIIVSQLAKYTAARGIDLHVVNISTEAVKMSIQGWSLYCSSKTAMERHAQCVTTHSHNRTITSESVDPGPMDTAMQEYLRANTSPAFVTREYYVRMAETGKLKKPEVAAMEVLKAIQLTSRI